MEGSRSRRPRPTRLRRIRMRARTTRRTRSRTLTCRACRPRAPHLTGPWRAVWYPSTVSDASRSRRARAPRVARSDRVSAVAASAGRAGGRTVSDRPGPPRARARACARPVRVGTATRRTRGATRGPRRRRQRLQREQLIALVAEVSVGAAGDVRVDRVVTSIDCGVVLNRLGVMGQAESGIAWGLSATLGGKIDFRNGAAVQGTYADFAVLRIDDMPQLVVDSVDSDANPGGFGEHPVPLVAPAVANAVSRRNWLASAFGADHARGASCLGRRRSRLGLDAFYLRAWSRGSVARAISAVRHRRASADAASCRRCP